MRHGMHVVARRLACLRQRQVKQRLQELRVDALGDRASGALAHAVSEQL